VWVWFVLVHDLIALGVVAAFELPDAVLSAFVFSNPVSTFRVLVLKWARNHRRRWIHGRTHRQQPLDRSPRGRAGRVVCRPDRRRGATRPPSPALTGPAVRPSVDHLPHSVLNHPCVLTTITDTKRTVEPTPSEPSATRPDRSRSDNAGPPRRSVLRGAVTAATVGIGAIAGCLGDEAPTTTEPPDPIALGHGKACDACGMLIVDHGGPNGQVFYVGDHPQGRDGPAWYDSLTELVTDRPHRRSTAAASPSRRTSQTTRLWSTR